MLYEALVEEIKRKAFIAKSMGQEFTDENYLEEIEKSMGRAQMGEVRTWGGKEYVKTPKGWRPKPKGYKEKQESGEKKGQGESLVDMINRKLREGHAAVKDSMKDDAKKIAEGDKNRGKDSKALKKEISSGVKKLNEMNDRLEDLEDLMYGDEDDEMGTLENQSEYGDEYEELDGKFQKLAKNLKTSIRKYMKDINPDWKEPADADVWDFIREFNKAKARKSQG